MAGEKLIKLMQDAAKMTTPNGEKTDLVFGVVTQIDPIKVKIDNRFEVDETFLLFSPLVRAQTFIDEGWRGLRTGDNVRMLRVFNGQGFYILDRGETL